MAIVTLVADTAYSALTLANGDSIDCAGYILTLDIQPTETEITVTSPATNGRVVFSGAWELPTWDFEAGASTTAGMINSLPTGAVIRSVTGGSASNSRGINTNSGTVATANGGSGSGAHGVSINNGTVTTANSGSGSSAHGVASNNGTVTTANGGATSNASGVSTNNGSVTTANGGSASNSHGVLSNLGSVTTANGGSATTAYGVSTNSGVCLRLTDSTGRAVGIWNGSTCFVEGPFVEAVIPNNIKTIYSLGTLSGSATIAGDATVITLSEGSGGGGASFPLIGGGGLVI